MTDQGKAKKAVILELIKNLDQFNKHVDDEIKAIKQNAEGLSECWHDPQYESFLAYTGEITAQLKKDISLLVGVRDNLKIKADKF